MQALGVMAIRGPKEEFAVDSMDSIKNTDPYEVGARIAQESKDKNPRINMIHFLPSVMDIIPTDRAIEGIESVFGVDVPVFGGLSIDNMKFISSFQFAGDRIIERGAVAIGFADPTLELIMQANHGLNVVGEPFEVTRSESSRIYELDGKPAWKALTERLGLPETTPPIEMAALSPLARKLPQEFHEEYGSPYILCSGPLKEDDGSIKITSVCPVGTKLWMAQRDEDKIFNELDRMVGQLADRIGERKALAVFHADCAIRGRLSFRRILKEEIISRMQYPICKDETVPWLGFYGGGEITQLGGRNMIHILTTSLYIFVDEMIKTEMCYV
jgi:hypothetical protein